MNTDLTARFSRTELDATATAIVKLSDIYAIWALADHLPLPKPGEAVRLTVTVPAEMVRAARRELDSLSLGDSDAKVIRMFLDQFDERESRS